jgi:hypothetical protein
MVGWLRFEVSHSPSSATEGNNDWSYTSNPPQAFMGVTDIILDIDCNEFNDCPTDFTPCAQFQKLCNSAIHFGQY